MTIHDVLNVLFPTGIAAVLMLLVNGWKSWRDSKTVRDETYYRRLQRELIRADQRNQYLQDENDWLDSAMDQWRLRSADLEWHLRSMGIEVPPNIRPMPPRPRKREPAGSARAPLGGTSAGPEAQFIA